MKRIPLEDRFWEKVSPEPNSGCWLWTASCTQDGYGNIRSGGRGKMIRSHRLSYEMHIGPIPLGMEIDHLCRVRCCVNPDHLEVVTKEENYRRGLGPLHWKQKTHCIHGHPFDVENTYWHLGKRNCRQCNRNAKERYRAKAMLGTEIRIT